MAQKESSLDFIVGVGASAGGLEALQELFANISNHDNMAFIIVQHLSPDFESLMDELLKKYTPIKISTPTKPTLVKPNNIYLISKNRNLIYKDGQIVPIEKDPALKLNLPIDIFLQSLGENAGEKSIGIILSGTGTDGSRGIRSIKENGGLVFVQDPESAKFDGMPRASIKVGVSDAIETPKKIGEIVSQINTKHTLDIAKIIDPYSVNNNEYFTNIINLLKEIHSVDFTLYRSETLIRRTKNRMHIRGCKSLKDYYQVVLKDADELFQLYNDFLIGVTKFFRDTKAWLKIKTDVIPQLVKSASPSGIIRVWSVGSSTGEEAYSIAVLLEEEIRKTKSGVNYKIFATDASKTAIDFASRGIFNDNIAGDIEPKFLHDYFSKKDYTYHIHKNIREKIIFSQHDCLNDPPIIGVDILICRNLMIYLKPEIQRMLLNNFQFSLNHNGFLFLGISEHVGKLDHIFKSIDKNYKIFQNTLKRKLIPQTKTVSSDFSINRHTRTERIGPIEEIIISSEKYFKDELHREHVPASLFVTDDFNILYSYGSFDKYLSIPAGILKRYNLLDMVDKSTGLLIRNGLRTALKENKTVEYNDIKISKGENTYDLNVFFKPKWFEEYNKKICLIEIRELKEKEGIIPVNLSNLDLEHINLLEMEIKELKYELQKSKEELEASNEELQASNEELLGANEELQSSNEELQSVNEELYAVNNEFQVKIKELSELNDDINNLFSNLDNAVIYLDKDLNIRKLTPKTEDIFNFSNMDIGRPIIHFSSWLDDDNFIKKVKKVMDTPTVIEYQTIDNAGNFYFIRIIPYKTSENVIDGVVITLNDISEIAKAQEKLEIQEHLIAEAGELANLGAWEYNPTTEEFYCSLFLKELIGFKGSKPIDFQHFLKVFKAPDLKYIEKHLIKEKDINNSFDFNFQTKDNRIFRFKATWQKSIKSNEDILYGFLQDITHENEIYSKYKSILKASLDGFFIVDYPSGKLEETNPAFEKLTGYTNSELTEMYLWDIDAVETEKLAKAHMEKVIELGGMANFKSTHKRKDGSTYEAEIKALYLSLGKPKFVCFIEDITERIENENLIKNKNSELKKLNKELDTFVYRISHDLRAPLSSALGLTELLKSDNSKEELQELVELQDKALKSMDSFIKDILDYSRNTRLKKTEDEININAEIENALSMLSHYENYKKIEKIVEVDCNLSFFADHFRFEVIINNLISNAIKFADLSKKNPYLKISANCNEKVVKLIVEDNGIGISKEYEEKIFEMFFRATEQVQGTGIGLYILKESLDILKGKIKVESELGKGSKFIVEIPNHIKENK